MSLLLEALKKAEKAKEDAQRRARDGTAGGEPATSAFDAEATVAVEGRHVMRRDELPDISAPLEIVSDDLRPAAQSKSAAPLELMRTEEPPAPPADRKSTRLNSSHSSISYAVFCLKKKMNDRIKKEAGKTVKDEYLFRVNDALEEVESEIGKTVRQVALALLLSCLTVDRLIIGARD